MSAGFGFSSGQNAATGRGNVMRNFVNLVTAICNMLPAPFKVGDTSCRRVLRFIFLRFGSIQVSQDVDGSGYSSGTDASSAINNAISTNGIAGATVTSSSTTSTGYSGSSDSDVNLGLILGVSIPLVILRTSLLSQWL